MNELMTLSGKLFLFGGVLELLLLFNQLLRECLVVRVCHQKCPK